MTHQKIEETLFLLCLIFLPSQLGKHFWPTFSFIYSLPIDYLSPTIYFWSILVLILIIFWLLRQPKLNWKAINLGLFFILTTVPSLLSAQNPGAGLVQLNLIIPAVLFGIYLASQDFKKIKYLLFLGLSIAVTYESIIAIFEFISGRSLNLWILGERSFSISTPAIATFNYFGQVFLRPYATFPHPNVLAAFMVIALPLLWVLREDSINKGWRYLNLGLASFVTLLTFSRGSILVLLTELVIGLRAKIKFLIIPVVIILPLLWIRYSSVFNFDNLSIIRREELAVIAFNDFKASPIFGIGLNNFINQTAGSDLVSGADRFLQPVHNIFLLSLSETGLVGFMGSILMCGYPIYALWKQRTNKFNQSLLFCWGIIIFLGMFDHYFLTLPQGQRLFFLIWGLSMLQ